MKRAYLVTLAIPNYRIITQTAVFVYLPYRLWDHMPLLVHEQSTTLITKYHFPANIYLFEVNKRNMRKKCEIRLKLTIKTPEQLLIFFWWFYWANILLGWAQSMSQLACTPRVYTYRRKNMKDSMRTKFTKQVPLLHMVLKVVVSDFQEN